MRILILGWLVCGAIWAQDRALLVTISNYRQPVPSLRGVRRDMDRAKGIARKMGFTNVTALEEATTLQLIRALDQLAQGAEASRVLIYLSMHGAQVEDRDRDERDSDYLDEVLVTSDTVVFNGQLRNYIPDDHLNQRLRAISAQRLLIIVDTCFSGSMEKGLGEKGLDDEEVKFAGRFDAGDPGSDAMPAAKSVSLQGPRSVTVLAATQENEVARGTEKFGSYFTRALDLASDDDAPHSLEEWMDKARRIMKESGVSQNPTLKAERSPDRLDWFAAARRGR